MRLTALSISDVTGITDFLLIKVIPSAGSLHNVNAAVQSDHSPFSEEVRQSRLAMRLSLGIGVFMLLGKGAAYFLTGSAAILSDAAESVIHVIAVAFAAFSLWLSSRPANKRFLYGYERITFFSAGFEGAMIILAAIAIIYAAIDKWLKGLAIQNL